MAFNFGSTTATTGLTFGATPAAPNTGFAFGAPATATTTTTTATTAPATTATTGFTFGAPAATTTGSNFGFGFGVPAPAATVPAAPVGPPPQPSGAILPYGGIIREVQDPIVKRINDISDTINITSPQCQLQYVLYNLLPPNSPFREKLTKPPHANDDVWRRGLAENPEPDRLVPCLVVGWPDLLIRLQEQQRALNTHIETMQHLAQTATGSLLSSQQQFHRQIEEAKQKQSILNSRIMNIISRIHNLKCGNMPLTEAEYEYKQRLIQMHTQINTPGEFLDKIQSLSELVTIQANIKARERSNLSKEAEKDNTAAQALATAYGSNVLSTPDDDPQTREEKDRLLLKRLLAVDGEQLEQYDLATMKKNNVDKTAGSSLSSSSARTHHSTLPNQPHQLGANNVIHFQPPSEDSNSDREGSDDGDGDGDDDETLDYDENGNPTQAFLAAQRNRMKKKLLRGHNLRTNIHTLLNVVNDQSKMIKELVDEVSLCITDLQLCDEALNPDFN